MVDVIAVLKAGMGSTQPTRRRALKDTMGRGKRYQMERANPVRPTTDRASYADQLREEMDPNQEMEGDIMDVQGMPFSSQDPSNLEALRDSLKYLNRGQQAMNDPQIKVTGEPMQIAWQLLKEQISDFSSLPPAIQSMMAADAARRERGFQTTLRDKQRPLQEGKKATFTEEAGTPIGVDLPPDQRTLRIAPDAPSTVPAGGRPDLMGDSDMPRMGDESFFEEQYVPHADTALEPHEPHPQPEVGAGGAIDDESMEAPTRLKDRANRHLQDVSMEQLMGDETMSRQIDAAAAGLERYDKMINALKDGPGKEQMKRNRDFYQEKVMGPLMAMLDKRKRRLERKQPHVGTPQRYEYGVERMDEANYPDGE